MTVNGLPGRVRWRDVELAGAAAVCVAAAMIGVLFAGSTMLTPLYVIYKQQFGFSQITLTLIYAVYVVGNLAALLVFGRVSDAVGRRRTAMLAIALAVVSALIFLFAQDTASLFVGRILSGLAIGIGAGTGTAWLSELIARRDKARAAMIATSTNFVGLGLGALVSGLLAEYAPSPLHLSFVVYLVALIVTGALVCVARETVTHRPQALTEFPMRPRLSVPRAIRAQFVAPAVTGAGAMALVGFYAALAPSVLVQQLHDPNHAVAGALFLELAIVVAGSIVAMQRVPSRSAMLWGLALMLPSVVLLVSAQIIAAMPLMILATVVCGLAAGLGYRGSLQVVNKIAPESRRAEVVSSYFVWVFCGNAVPVIGIGVLSTLASPTAASLAFAAMIIVFALLALFFGSRYTR
ncbi:MAG TPA: MFS transporter [Xanthobacteraceae bacterium]|jgi:MFS family permease